MGKQQSAKSNIQNHAEELSSRFENVKEQLGQKLSSLEERVTKVQQNRKKKKKAGRPKKSAEERASDRIIFRLKPAESEQLQSLAEPGESIGQTARRLIIELIKNQEQDQSNQ